jgi:L-lactate dehydrogenase complex protein LldF
MSERSPSFREAARSGLANSQQRRNLRRVTTTIGEKRAHVVSELDDWEQLREAGKRIKEQAMRHLDVHLEQLEERVTQAGGIVHWARDGDEANSIVARLIEGSGSKEAIKVKSMVTHEIGLDEALRKRGIVTHETDLAELIIQLSGDRSSHIVVPALHRNRSEIRDVFARELAEGRDLPDRPESLAEIARLYLREKFLSVDVGISGANFAVAETGTVCVVESEGNGRMCTTLPRMLITVMGIEKLLPRFSDLEVMLQLLPRSATGERMNPYTSLWNGVSEGDGPQEFHLVLLDAGRTATLADETGRQALHCIRCAACLNVCPVYERAGGHAYGATYPGPIGAIITPQLSELESGTSLPWASSLCGACYEVCPVKIDIPSVLVDLRGRIVEDRKALRRRVSGESLAMGAMARVFSSRRRYEAAQRGAGLLGGAITHDGRVRASTPGPLQPWRATRELKAPVEETFRQWWSRRGASAAGQ